MTYIYECDGFCEPRTEYRGRPALTAEFNEDWFHQTRYGDVLEQHDYTAGDLITLCPECTQTLLIERP